MNVFELLKSVKEFKIGDFVVLNKKLFCVSWLPTFCYKIEYTDGDYDYHNTDEFNKIRGNKWEMLGYGLTCIDDKNKLYTYRYELFGNNIELYNPDLYPHFVNEHKRMLLLQEIELLNDKY